ncbi:MAG TPA: alkaline phosphatase family protein [Candidatus Angelobacter sp.]|nr:alkaline phosphatase family protein [Candidatus Angelobacter sp.]
MILVAGLAYGQHQTTTPIKHVVVIFQENVSFDHYFATYPNALNPSGEPRFVARRDTPSVNGLSGALLTNNLNLANPFRFSRAQAATCDQDHDYKDEQTAFDHGAMDKFVQTVGNGPGTDGNLICKATDVMGYFDGNTVTALWNYAQHFAMSDNSFGTTFGPSTPGVLNLVSGQTAGATPANLPTLVVNGSVVGDSRPALDDCSPGGGNQANQIVLSGKNVGDLLNAKGITWGFFQGGFKPTAVVNGVAVCGATHTGSDGLPKGDYIPHHQGFQYYASTTNQHHLPPSSVGNIGKSDQAKHQYDISDFFDALNAHNFPEVVFLKAPGFQDGHAGYSDPLAEQEFVVNTINRLQEMREWSSTAVIISYDDSDGWYDHVMGPIVTPSNTIEDTLTGTNACGTAVEGITQGKCGLGPRLPLLVISPWAKRNFVDGTLTDQSSIMRFIEDNWSTGRIGGDAADQRAGTLLNMFDFRHGGDHDRRLFLDPKTGEVIGGDRDDDDRDDD